MNKAIFLDRDGTINEEMGYINHIDRFKIFPFVPESIRIFNKLNYKVVVVTNQSGVARGYFNESLVVEIHEKLKEFLMKKNANIDAIYYCPHHPSEGSGKYKKDCFCRKPKTGMIERAVSELNIDLKGSYLISDRYKDILFAKKMNITTALVLTGYGKGEYTYQRQLWKEQPEIIGKDLLEIAKKIETDVNK